MANVLQAVNASALSLVGELGPKHADALQKLASDLLESIKSEGAKRDQTQEAALQNVTDLFDRQLQALSEGLHSHISAELREELSNIKRCVIIVYIFNIVNYWLK